MVKVATCQAVFKGHCNHWRLSEAAHALVHAQMRRMDEVAAIDQAAGVVLGQGDSTTSVAEDGPALEALLLDEGYMVIPIGPGARA